MITKKTVKELNDMKRWYLNLISVGVSYNSLKDRLITDFIQHAQAYNFHKAMLKKKSKRHRALA